MRTIDTGVVPVAYLAQWLNAIGIPLPTVRAQTIDVDDAETGCLIDVARTGKPGTETRIVRLPPECRPSRWGLLETP